MSEYNDEEYSVAVDTVAKQVALLIQSDGNLSEVDLNNHIDEYCAQAAFDVSENVKSILIKR